LHGPNGIGKTTFLEEISNNEAAGDWTFFLGCDVVLCDVMCGVIQYNDVMWCYVT
jgi:hypothetical protein